MYIPRVWKGFSPLLIIKLISLSICKFDEFRVARYTFRITDNSLLTSHRCLSFLASDVYVYLISKIYLKKKNGHRVQITRLGIPRVEGNSEHVEKMRKGVWVSRWKTPSCIVDYYLSLSSLRKFQLGFKRRLTFSIVR